MSDKKHIDRLFQEKFKDFDVIPDDKLWDGIEARLEQKKKKQRIIPIWWKLGGVAAAIILMFVVGSTFNEDNNLPAVVGSETNKIENNNQLDADATLLKENTTVTSENLTETNSDEGEINSLKRTDKYDYKTPVLKSKSNSNVSIAESENSTLIEKQKTTLSTFDNLKPNRNAVASTSDKNIEKTKKEIENKTQLKSQEEIKSILNSDSDKTNVIVKTDKNGSNTSNAEETKFTETSEKIATEKLTEKDKGQDIEDAIAEAKTNNEEEKEIRRWSIAPNVAPVYFNSLGEGSSIDAQFNSNNTTSDINMSYGVKGSYAVNERLKITAGVNRVSFNNITNDVIALSDNSFASNNTLAASGRLQNVQLNGTVKHESLTLLSRPNISNNAIPEAINTLQTGNLEQRFGFIEIPLEVEYRVIDRKLGVNVSGGFSTLLLNENEILADVNGQSALIGEANNLNNTSFSANFGVGLDYNLSEKININLEPKFKYQLNTFNNTTGDFRPFFIGVYTGLSFKF